MAAYISVPRDLTKVKSKVAFNLTKRQLLCFGTAALIGVPLFFVLRDSGGNTAATLGMMAVMLPAFFLGMYEKNGQPLEKLLSHYVQARFLRPKIRPYKTNNYYAILMRGGSANAGQERCPNRKIFRAEADLGTRCRRISEAEAKPGDLVFFKGIYDTPGMSHTGIYLGNGMMVSAGDPIKYANIHSSYWEKHLAGFGRLSK